MRTDLQIVSTFSAILPIVFGSIVLFRHKSITALWGFLVYGLLTDVVVMLYVLKMLPSVTLSDAIIIHNLYGLVDVILLLFVIQFFLELKRRAIIQIGVFLVFFVFWYLSYFIFVELNSSTRSLSAVFDTVSELCIAVAAAYALLQLTKPGHKSPLWILVILSSIFFYNFCSFFVAAFIDSNFIKDIWFLNSILNILTMLGYSLGFWLVYRSRMKLSNE